jgi:hypothetical protein
MAIRRGDGVVDTCLVPWITRVSLASGPSYCYSCLRHIWKAACGSIADSGVFMSSRSSQLSARFRGGQSCVIELATVV